MVSVPQLALRVLQFLCVLIALALVAASIDDQFFGNSSVNWAMFVAVFSMIVVFYGMAAAFVESLAQPMILGAMDGLATLFNFIAGVVLAARLGVHSCSNRVSLMIRNVLAIIVANKHLEVSFQQQLDTGNGRKMPDAPGCHCIFLVRFCLVRCVHRYGFHRWRFQHGSP